MAKRFITAAIIAAMAIGNAQAAYLSDIQGAVLVNNQPAKGDTQVSPGDRVKALTGSVKVVYNNGAVVPVTAGQTVVVLASNSNSSAPPPPANTGNSGIFDDSNTLIIGGLVVAGGIGLGIALSQNNSPASP